VILFLSLATFNLLIAYGTQEWQRRALRLHVENIYDALQYELAVGSLILRGKSNENFQLAIMLHYDTETWFPEVRYNMEEGQGQTPRHICQRNSMDGICGYGTNCCYKHYR
jgi:hypothetical protein